MASLPPRLSVLATKDLESLRAYHQAHGSHRVLQLDLTLEGLLRQIQEFPTAYPLWRPSIRRIITRRFYLAIFYMMMSDHILILGITDQRQDPRRLRFLTTRVK